MRWSCWVVAAVMTAPMGIVQAQTPASKPALEERAMADRGKGKLKFLYCIRMTYPQGWSVNVSGDKGTEAYHFYLAEGTVEGRINGKLKGANQPRTRPDGTFLPDLKGVIETDDGTSIIFNIGGYGRGYPVGRRQIVATVLHVTDDKRYSWLKRHDRDRNRRGADSASGDRIRRRREDDDPRICGALAGCLGGGVGAHP